MKKGMFFLCLLVLVVIAAPAYAINWDSVANLLTNPGAESGDLSGWSSIGPFYATTMQDQSGPDVYPHSGNYFFSAAQSPSSGATITQIVDVSSYAALIDSGLALYNAGLWYQTEYWNGAMDLVQAAVVFYASTDGSGSGIDADVSDEMGIHADWAYAGTIGTIPLGTRSIKIEINGLLRSGTYVNAFVDDTHLKIAENVIPEPTTLLLFGSSLLGLVGFRRRKSRSTSSFSV